jgi:alkanesulfonate monooxygenase SsuD/methylene tetrahydromethanopterin reductase-like flavin-dependent oxidoreductase (luciferase family)
MGRRITDEILDTFAVRGTPEEIAPQIQQRLGDVVDRVSLYMPYGGSSSHDVVPRIFAGLRQL